MRFKLILEVNKRAFGNVIPINYQYEQAAAIYKMLSYADEKYATWLHENGFQLENGKQFKLFTFSRFKIEKRHIIKEEGRIQILSDTIEWQISFLPEKSTQQFIQGLFKNQFFEIGDKTSVVQFRIRSVEAMPSPEFSKEMTFSTMSPLCIKFKREDGKTDHLPPTDIRSKYLLFNGLLDRYQSFYGKPLECTPDDCSMDILNEPKSVRITIKADTPEKHKVKGYMFQFKAHAPIELMQLMYESGAGSLCSQGFGCLKIENTI
ncbi:CRISPR-associated endoribonuclease Cas6 [Bacteroides sp.]